MSRGKEFGYAEYFVRQQDSDEPLPAVLALAEHLTPDEVWQLNKDLSDHGKIAKVFDTASANLELALCSNDPAEKERALGQAAVLLAEVHERGHEKLRNHATVMLDFMPAFEARMRKEQSGAEVVAGIYRQLGSRALVITAESPKFFYELLLFAAAARTGDANYLVMPASVREESGSSRKINYNHDGYVLRDIKIPIQAKSEFGNDKKKKYMPGIRPIYMRRIMSKAAAAIYGKDRFGMYDVKEVYGKVVRRKLIQKPQDLQRLVQHTATVLFEDSSQAAVGPQDQAYLLAIQEAVNDGTEICYGENVRGEWPTARVPEYLQASNAP